MNGRKRKADEDLGSPRITRSMSNSGALAPVNVRRRSPSGSSIDDDPTEYPRPGPQPAIHRQDTMSSVTSTESEATYCSTTTTSSRDSSRTPTPQNSPRPVQNV
ncbi:unnamed protein product [Caenorhabditis angaria]|uniref:Uncharacterized protein n=1 Tax=Caenorhabditis angaria TaxID=860376 RepID=A0A9P1J2T2_9PELO|nr:unnamed protein product [Caenorhabditis angaria]